MAQQAEIHQLDSIEQFTEFVYAHGRTDGLPVFPPTDSAVTVMKAGEHSQLAVPINTVGLNECITLLARGIGRVGLSTSGGRRGYI